MCTFSDLHWLLHFFVKQRLTSLYPFSLTTTEQNTKIFKMCACVYVCVLQAMLMNEWM